MLDTGYEWTVAASSALELYVRAPCSSRPASFVALTGISIVAKWLLIGQFEAGSDPDLELCLFPLLGRQDHDAHLAGDGLHRHADLQCLSAPDGREDRPQARSSAAVTGRSAPTCLSIGDNTILRKDTIVLGYRAQSNFIHIGPVEIGANAFVGEASVIDIDTDDGRRHAARPCLVAAERPARAGRQALSRLARGRDHVGLLPDREPRGQHAAQRRRLHRARARRAVPRRRAGCRSSPIISGISTRPRPASALGVSALSLLGISAALFFGSIVAWARRRSTSSRASACCSSSPASPIRRSASTTCCRASSCASAIREFFCVLFGDSSFITTYMRYVGWNLNKVEQTGSNMGTNQRHDNPFLCNIGSGTMVSDGLSMINTHMSATSFQLAEAKIGEQQLSRQRHLLSAERQDRRERAARHQDHDPDRRAGARERRPARLARIRNPAHGRPRPRHERLVRRGDAPRPPAPEESLQLRDRADLPAAPLDVGLRGAGALDGRARLLRPLRRVRAVRRDRRDRWRLDRVLRAARAREPCLQAARAEDRVDLRPVFLVPRAALEAVGVRRSRACSPARRSAP